MVNECVIYRDRDSQGGSVGVVASQGGRRGQTGWTKVTLTVAAGGDV